MPLTTRYSFADTPHLGNPSLEWVHVSSPSVIGATTLVLNSIVGLPSGTEFDIEVGERQSDGTVSNAEIAHVLSVSGTTLTLEVGLTFAHAALESVYHTLTKLGLKNSPQALTDSGDISFLNASGRMDRFAAPSDGDYVWRWTSGVPSYTTGPTFGSLITAPDFHWSGGKVANTVLAGPVSGGDAVPTFRNLVLADIPDLSSLYIGAGVLVAYAVPLTRTVNGHALSSNVVVSASDLGTGTLPLARLTGITTTQFASAAVSQWTNDSSYVTPTGAAAFTNKTGAISQWTNDSGYATAASATAFTNKTGNISQWTNDSGYLTSALGGSISNTQVAFGSGSNITGSANLTWVPPMLSVGGTTTARIDWKTTGHTVDMLLTNLTNRFTVSGAGSYIFDAVVNATAFAYPDTSGNGQLLYNSNGLITGITTPSDNNYALNFASGVPSYVSAPTWATLATPPTNTALGSSGAKFDSLNLNITDTSLLYVGSSGRVSGFGAWDGSHLSTQSLSPASITALAVIGNGGPGIFVNASGNANFGAISDANGTSTIALFSSGGTLTTPTKTNNGDYIGTIEIFGFNDVDGWSFAPVQFSVHVPADWTGTGVTPADIALTGHNSAITVQDGGVVWIAAGYPDFSLHQDSNPGSLFVDGSVTATDFIVSGSRFKSDTTNGHTGGLAVYRTGVGYEDILVWTNNTAPAVVLSTPAGGTFSGDFSTLTIANAAVATQSYVNAQGFLTSATNISGNAGTATALQTARAINGTSFDGTAAITVTAAAGTLTGSTLASDVTASSLTSVGTIATGVWSGTAITVVKGGTGATSASIAAFNNITGYMASGATGTTSTNIVFSTSPTLVTPALGTPSALVLTNATGLPEGGLSLTDITTGNATTSAHGFVPKFPGGTTTFLRADGTYAAPAGGGSVTSIATTSPISGGAITTTGTISLLVNTDFAFTAGQTITSPAGSKALTLAGGTQTSSFPALDISQTWNAAATFTAIKLNVTATSSNAASLLMDLQVGGTSKFQVDKNGSAYSLGGNSGGFWLDASQTSGIYNKGTSGNFTVYAGNTERIYIANATPTIIQIASATTIAWTNGVASATVDTLLNRGGIAATLQMGADVNGAAVGQTFQSCRGITGTDKTGAPFHFVAGPGTGAATVSYIDFTTPTVTTTGTTQQASAVRFRIEAGLLTVSDATDFVFNATTGTKHGTATSQKQSFWNATPIVQPASASQASITDSTGGVAASSLVDVTTAAVSDPTKVNANFATVNVLLLAMRTALVNTGLMKGAA